MRLDMPALAAQSCAPVAAIYVQHLGTTRFSANPQVIVAAWKNGDIVWSDNATEGGPPYSKGNTNPEFLESKLADLSKRGVFGEEHRYERHHGPSSSFTTIVVAHGQRCLQMASWHELFEVDPNLVATSEGIEHVGSGNRDEILAGQPGDYLRFRRRWDNLRAELMSLIPDHGEPAKDVEFSLTPLYCKE